MYEDAIDVYNRHKLNLLKSIYESDDSSEEIEEYLLSLLNLENQGLTLKSDIVDRVCMFTSEVFLKSRRKRRQEASESFFAIPEGERTKVEMKREGMNRIASMSAKRRKLGRKQAHELTRSNMADASNHRYLGRLEGEGLMGMMHGAWPSARPDQKEDYSVHHPFHEDLYPLLRKDPVTGVPRFASMLVDYIKSGQAKIDDELDRKHERHFSSNGAVRGIDSPLGGKTMPFIGPLTIGIPEGVSVDGEEPTNGIDNHALYERSFKRWKKENPDKVKELDEDEQREAHFDDSIRSWTGSDIMDKEVDPSEGMSDEEFRRIMREEGVQTTADGRIPEALRKYKENHARGIGWLSYMLGLEWLEPDERTEVLDHFFTHGSDDPEKQTITLNDKTVIPVGRIKRNIRARSTPELNYFMRAHDETSPNVPANLESESDTRRPPAESGAIGNALSSYVDPKSGLSAEQMILEEINRYIAENTKKHGLHANTRLTSLFGFDEKQRKLLRSMMDEGSEFGEPNDDFEFGEPKGNPHVETLKEHALISPSHQLTKRDALRLMGYNPDLSPMENHDLFDTIVKDVDDIGFKKAKPLLDRKHLEPLMKMFDLYMGAAKNEKEYRNAESDFVIGHNGFDLSSVDKDRAGLMTSENGLLRGRADFWNKPFEIGGMPISDTQYRDFLHALTHMGDGAMEDVTSLIGDFMDVEHDLSGVMLNDVFSANKGVTGLFGHLLKDILGPDQTSSHTPEQILSPFDQSDHNQGDHAVDQFGNPNWPRNRKQPLHTGYSKSVPLTSALTKVHPRDHKDNFVFERRFANRSIDGGRNYTSNWATVTGTGSKSGEFSDSLAERNARKMVRSVISRGSHVEPGVDDITGMSRLGASSRLLPWNDIVNGKYEDILPGMEHNEIIQLLSPSMALRQFNEETYELQETLNDMIADLEQEDDITRDAYQRGQISTKPDERMIADLKEQIAYLKEVLNNKLMDTVSGASTGRDQSDNDYNKTMLSEILAKEQIVRDVIMPAMLTVDPSAFDPENPTQTVANIRQAFHDAEQYLLTAPQSRHNLSTFSPGITTKKQKSAQMIADKPVHMPIAQTMRDKGLTLTSDMTEKDILEELGLPVDKQHQEYIRRVIGDRDLDATPLKIMTVGDILASGTTLETKKFASVRDRGKDEERREQREPIDSEVWHDSEDHHALIDRVRNETPIATGNRRNADIRAFTTRHPLFLSLNGVDALMNARQSELDSYGLEYHRADDNDSMYGDGSRRAAKPLRIKANVNRAKSIAHNMILFEEGKVGNLEEREDVGAEDMDTIGMHTTEIHPPRTRMGTPISTHFTSGARMHFAPVVSPSVATTVSDDGIVSAGTEVSPTPLLNPSDPSYRAVLGDQGYSALLQNMDNYLPEQTSSNAGESMQIAQDIVKADLPKEIPLIEPYHKVFGVEDLEELSGFTGEWVVSVYHEGDRVKINRKGSRVDITDEDNNKVSTLDSVRASLRALTKKDYVVDAVMNNEGVFVNDILIYDDSDVTDLPTRERVKLLRGQFDSHEDVIIPSPQTLKVTDDTGLEAAAKTLLEDNEGSKLLFRDAVSTYMRGEEKHPKWALMTKSDDDFHIPFAMEMDDDKFILHFSDDMVKYDIVDDSPVNPFSAMGSLSGSDYSIKLAKSLESYWQPAFDEMLKEKKMEEPSKIKRRSPKEIEDQSAGVIEAKDEEKIMKPTLVKGLLLIEAILDRLEKGHSNMHGRGFGFDFGADGSETPTGPTSLNSEQSLPDYDMKKRPTEDPESPEDYPKRGKKKSKRESADII